MRIRYELDDGYAGPARPHYVKVDDEDLAACESREQQWALVDEIVDQHFRATCTPHWDESQLPPVGARPQETP